MTDYRPMAVAGNRETTNRIKALYGGVKERSKRLFRTGFSTVFRRRSRQKRLMSTNETDCTSETPRVHKKPPTSILNGAPDHPPSVVANTQPVAAGVIPFPISTYPTLLSSSGRDVPSDSNASTAIDTSAPSRSGSWPSGAPFKAEIVVRGPHDSPKNEIKVHALLDTGFDDRYCLMASSHFDRLNKDGRITLVEPLIHEIEGLHGSRKKARGIARDLEWHLANGEKTYKSDFLIVDLSKYDVLISSDTLWEAKLVRVGSEIRRHFEKSKRQQEDGRRFTHGMAAD